MKEANIFELWCQANAKEITVETFEKEVGENFHDFFKKNKRYCLSNWRRRTGIKNKWHPEIERLKKAKYIPQYIFYKEQKLKERLAKIRELKKEILKS